MTIYDISPGFLQRFAWIPLRVVLTVFCSLKIRGVENIESIEGSVVIAISHTSELDPLLVVACMSFFSRHLPFFYVTREKKFYSNMDWKRLIYGGTFFKLMGAYPALVGLKNYEIALQHHLNFIRDGKNVCIFPSGKIALGEKSLKARGGVSFLAQKTNRPIIPILIQGADNISLWDVFSGKRKITVTIGMPLWSKDIFRDGKNALINKDRNDYEEAATILMEKIARLA
ncbi:MAG: lysophospholipid acyltransferase family protein [Candidatus Taylorbacteria bacterium]|nr:lysophospholipid acyltransferase family protein [Candidatus Taylorbacteria bacterium]